jgi:hypothetical protein
MDFECTNDVAYPLDAVHRLVRDDMPAIVPYLKDVEEIRVLDRKDEPTGVRITNLWRGSASAAPSIVQRFVTPDMVTWTDHAFWRNDRPQAEWKLEPRVGGRLFECTGTTTVLPGAREDACRIQIKGRISVYPERLPGVPRLLAGTIRGKVEEFVVGMIVPNLRSLSVGVQGYFDAKRKGA